MADSCHQIGAGSTDFELLIALEGAGDLASLAPAAAPGAQAPGGDQGLWAPTCPARLQRKGGQNTSPMVVPVQGHVAQVGRVQMEHAARQVLLARSDLGPGDALVDTSYPRSCAGRRWHEAFQQLQQFRGISRIGTKSQNFSKSVPDLRSELRYHGHTKFALLAL